MPQMWVELTANHRVSTGGKYKDYHAGDRIYVSQFHAMQWINAGMAIPVERVLITTEIPSGTCGIVTPDVESVKSVVKDKAPVIVPGSAIFQRTLYLDSASHFRLDLLGAGFKIIEKWQCAAPLWSYTELAASVGTEEEQNRTRAIIKDLRVPMYDTRVLFVRDCKDTRKLMALWKKEQEAGGDKRLAFLRALYQVKPTICALPTVWVWG